MTEILTRPQQSRDIDRYTSGMPFTTIKVSTELRDKLKESANESGRTIAEQISYLVDRDERWRWGEELARQVRENPPDQEYWDEFEIWQSDKWMK